MTRRYRSLLVACTLGLAALTAAPLLSTTAQSTLRPAQVLAAGAPTADPLPPNTISINASGQVKVPPDMAVVTFGALAIRPSAGAAQAAVNNVIAAAVKNLHALRVNDRRIQTANISLEPRYDNNSNLTGYQANQTIAVIADTLAQVGSIVDAGVTAGANNGVSVAYGLKDENSARLAALKQAIANGRARADAAAASLGRSLRGAHVQLNESGQPVPQPVTNLQPAGAAARASADSTQSFGGTLTVREDITLTYTF